MVHKRSFASFLLIGLLAVSLACQAAANLPNPFATPTPTATNTPTATPTPTSTPTPIPSPTPRPTGVSTSVQEDGSTLVIDFDNGYQLALPQDWLVVPLTVDDIREVLNNLVQDDPKFADVIKIFENLDPDVIRVVAFNKNSKYVVSGYTTNLNVAAIDDKVMVAMPMAFVTGALEESLKGQGAEVLSTGVNVGTNPAGVEYGLIEYLQTTPTVQGKTVDVLSRMALFKTDKKLIVLSLISPKQFGDEFKPVLDKVVDSIKLVQP